MSRDSEGANPSGNQCFSPSGQKGFWPGGRKWMNPLSEKSVPVPVSPV